MPHLKYAFPALMVLGSLVHAQDPKPQPDGPAMDPATVEELTTEEAKQLLDDTGPELVLPSVRSLSLEAAHELGTYRNPSRGVPYCESIPYTEQVEQTYTVNVPFKEEATLPDGTKTTVEKSRQETKTRSVTMTRYRAEQKMRLFPCVLKLDALESADPQVLAALGKHEGHLHLNGLETLTREQAEQLANHKGGRLVLDGLAALDQESAELLAAHQGELSLNGLTELSPEVASALSTHKGRLSLNGLTTLSPETARMLLDKAGPELVLPRVGSLSLEAADELGTHRTKSMKYTVMVPFTEQKESTYTVDVPFTEEMTLADGTKKTVKRIRKEERARSYTVTRCRPEERTQPLPQVLQLNALESADPQILAALAKHEGDLHLNGLTVLTREQAQHLANHKGGTLALNGLVALDKEPAELLAAHQGDLSLNGLTALSPEVVSALSRHKRSLTLNGLTTLSPEVAKALTSREGSLCLSGITSLSPEVATALSEQKGGIGLNGLTTLPPEVAEILARVQGSLCLHGITSLSPEIAKVFVARKDPLFLDGLTSISPELAPTIADFNGYVSLNGVTALDVGTARCLSKCKGGVSLNGVTALNDDVAAVLIGHAGPISLNGLATVSDEAVAVLCSKGIVLTPQVGEKWNHNQRLSAFEASKAYAEAEPLAEELVQAWERFETVAPADLACSLVRLGAIYQHQKKCEEAEKAYKRALAIQEGTPGPHGLESATTLSHLASVYAERKNFAESERLVRQALAALERRASSTGSAITATLSRLAKAYCDQGRQDQAESLLKAALLISESAYGPENEQTSSVRSDLAKLTDDQAPETPADPPPQKLVPEAARQAAPRAAGNEPITLEATVKAVDAEARRITVEGKTSKGIQSFDLKVTEKAGDLSSVKVGNRIGFTYDRQQRVVTRIMSSGH